MYFAWNVNEDTTYQLKDRDKVKRERGELGKFCAIWDRVLARLIKPPPADFVLTNFLKQVQDEGCMASIMLHTATCAIGQSLASSKPSPRTCGCAMRFACSRRPIADERCVTSAETYSADEGILELLRRSKVLEAVGPLRHDAFRFPEP